MPKASDLNGFGRPSNADFGNYVLTDASRMRLFRPAYQKHTMFRPIGIPDEAGTGLQPWYVPEDDTYTDWFKVLKDEAKVVSYLGLPDARKVSFISSVPGGREGQSPFDRFYDSLHKLSTTQNNAVFKQLGFTQAQVKSLIKTENRSDKIAVSRALPAVFLQGAAYMHGDDNFIRSPKVDSVLMLTKSAAFSFFDLLKLKNEDGSFALGDIFDYQTSATRMLHLLEWKQQLMLPAGWSLVATLPEPEGLNNPLAPAVGNGYAMRYIQGPKGLAGPTLPYNLKAFKPWNSVINFIDLGKQVELIASVMPATLVIYAFRNSEFEEFLPDWVKRQYNVVGSAAMGATEEEAATEGTGPAETEDPFGGDSAEPASDPFGGGAKTQAAAPAPAPAQAPAPVDNKPAKSAPSATHPTAMQAASAFAEPQATAPAPASASAKPATGVVDTKAANAGLAKLKALREKRETKVAEPAVA